MISNDELETIASRADRATPGPWISHATADEHSSNALYVSPAPDSKESHDSKKGLAENDPKQVNPASVVAITLLQTPLLCRPKEFEENTGFIAHARSDIQRLIAEIRRLKKRRQAIEE